MPFHWFAESKEVNYIRFFLLIKILRLYRASSLISIKKIVKDYQLYLRRRSTQLAIDNEDLANDRLIDHNHITRVIILGFLLRFTKNVVMFFALAYFGGILWLIWCEICLMYINPRFEPEWGEEDSAHNFLLQYDLWFINLKNPRPRYNVITTMMYFMITTMSTVGFGDLHPQSDAERIVCIIIFLVGGTFFSIIMGDFLDILN